MRAGACLAELLAELGGVVLDLFELLQGPPQPLVRLQAPARAGGGPRGRTGRRAGGIRGRRAGAITVLPSVRGGSRRRGG